MVINYVPGDECRVAIIRDGKLEEFFAERASAASHVGNICVGRVTNVEASIQAAFIDFGLDQNGFLHISDLHPQYFPGGEEQIERVGRKTPRRERPPIQQALKKGQEIVVQVIKEGIGAKGPTLTSYISIPGRYLVMMPDMDRVGVSRRVEDDETRRVMRETLDQLNLPDGFGFILRTAGMSRTKIELKRDLAYLQRLWKDMERRRAKGDKPRLLYAESDLLVRSLRDVLSPETKEVVIDDEGALRRAARFIKIVAPRSGVTLRRYDGPWPIFTAFGIEEQLRRMLKRDAPLPSGGGIVIDEAEALVAIDVNSGKMRQHGDAETTAYKTNIEAVEEICRQLRLRDLGGLVILDLIDMRSRPHRRDIEKRLRDGLKRDRARWQMLPISEFGLVELTRQRMRGSLRSANFASCPTCEGKGLLQRPESVAADAVRDLAGLLHHDSVSRVEFVVSPPVAGVLLSGKRHMLSRLELRTGKRIDVRVSDTIDVDRVIFYAYDEQGADVEIDRLAKPTPPTILEAWSEHPKPGADWTRDPAQEAAEEAAARLSEQEEAIASEQTEDPLATAMLLDEEDATPTTNEEDVSRPTPNRRRSGRRGGRRGRGRGARSDQAASAPVSASPMSAPTASAGGDNSAAQRSHAPGNPSGNTSDQDKTNGAENTDGKKRRRRRRRRGRRPSQDSSQEPVPVTSTAPDGGDSDSIRNTAHVASNAGSTTSGVDSESATGAPRKKRRRRRSRKQKAGEQQSEQPPAMTASATNDSAPKDVHDNAQRGGHEGAPNSAKAATESNVAQSDDATKKKTSRSRPTARKKKRSTKKRPPLAAATPPSDTSHDGDAPKDIAKPATAQSTTSPKKKNTRRKTTSQARKKKITAKTTKTTIRKQEPLAPVAKADSTE